MTTLPITCSVVPELNNKWLTVWFNQPERRNPLTDEVISDLALVFDAIAHRPDIRGVTLRGRGGFFCAGGDLKGFQALANGAADDAIKTSSNIGSVLAQLEALPQVTIAVIEGAAMAGGLGLACCCDVTVGLLDAKFGFSETRIGITPAQIAFYVLQKCGYSTGRRLMLTAAKFDGAEAAALGVLDQVVDDPSLLNEAEQQIIGAVLECAPGAVAACKRLIRGLQGVEGDQRVAFAAENFSACLQSDEGREGVASFLEKRRPFWFRESQ